MKYLYVLLLTLTVNACSGQRNQKTEESNVAPPTFEMVSVPTLITDPVERAEYLVKHYWDKFDFKDTRAARRRAWSPPPGAGRRCSA